MAAGAIGPIIQLVIVILGFLMERAGFTIAQKKSFYEYVKDMGHLGLVPVKLVDSAEWQLEQLKKLEEAQNGQEETKTKS